MKKSDKFQFFSDLGVTLKRVAAAREIHLDSDVALFLKQLKIFKIFGRHVN